MRNSPKPLNINDVYSPYTPGTDAAGIDPDCYTFTDDELEIRNGLYRHALAHGEVVNG